MYKKLTGRTLIPLICVMMVCVLLAACSPSDHGYSYTTTTIYTPKGTAVQALIIQELTQADYDSINTDMAQRYPDVQKFNQPTNKFNCHTYAWYDTTQYATVWINAPQQKNSGRMEAS